MSARLRVASVAAAVVSTAALITWWSRSMLASGDRVFLAVYVLWISTWCAAAAFAALGVSEWVSQRGEEVMDLKS